MEIFFKSKKLAKVLNEEGKLTKEYGVPNAKQVRLRLAVLAAAPTLAHVPERRPDRRHHLKGDYKGCFAVDAHHPFRIVFEPTHPPVLSIKDGGIDLQSVTAITILEIVDYH